MTANVHVRLRLAFFVMFALAIGPSTPGFAQVVTGNLVGTIRDSSGAVVPNADVVVTNVKTGQSLPVKSNQVGEYVAPYLEPGTFSVTVKAPGFKTVVAENNDVSVNETQRVDIVLPPGQSNEKVEVTAGTETIQTETSSVQGSLDETLLSGAVPNLNRNPWNYAGLLPDVIRSGNGGSTGTAADSSSGTQTLGVGIDSRETYSSFAINGSQPFNNDLRLDGISVMGSGWNAAVINPNVDGIGEVRVITNDYSAEYGRGQGIVLVTTKSGSNQFHGSAFEQVRNDDLNANSYANDAQGVSKGPYRLNQFGGTVGGPILKNKAFFFVSYEGFRFKEQQNGFLNVPTDEEKLGDFSDTLINNNGVPTPIELFDPFSVTQVGPNLYQRAQVPNADIRNLARGVDPVALTLLTYYPEPNSNPIDVYNDNNYYYAIIVPFAKNNINSRVDFQKGNQRFYGTFGFQKDHGLFPGEFGPKNPFQGARNTANPNDFDPYATIGDTWMINPTTVVDLRIGATRTHSDNSRPTNFPTSLYTTVGMPANIQAVIQIPGSAPDTEFQQIWSEMNEDGFFHKKERVTHFEVVSSISKSLGKWVLKNGVDYRIDLSNFACRAEGSARLDSPGWTGAAGSYSAEFVNAEGFTVPQDNTIPISGLNDANILMGAGAYAQLSGGFSVSNTLAAKNFALYSQNDWRATNKLTINLGLRWDLQPGPTDRYNKMTAFDYNGTNPFAGPGGMAFPGLNGYSRNLWDTHYRDFGPRLGFAYQVKEGFVVRGGYGITYIPTNTGRLDGCGDIGCRPFDYMDNVLPFGTQPNGVPIGTFHDENVSQIVPAPGPDIKNPVDYLVSSPSCNNCNIFTDRHTLNGRVQQRNLVLEKVLSQNWAISLGYTGASGSHMQLSRVSVAPFGKFSDSLLNCYRAAIGCTGDNSDILPGQGYIQTGVDRSQDLVPNPYNPNGTIPFQGLMGVSTISRALRDSPYPMFSGAAVDSSFGVSDYNAVTLQVTHRLAHSLDLTAHYTRSKGTAIEDTPLNNGFFAIQDFRNFDHNRKLADDDIPNRFIGVVYYDLPFGKQLNNKVLKGFVRGWKIGGVETLQSGVPMVLSGGSNGALNSFANRVPGQPLTVPKALQHWYDGNTTVTLPSGRQITPAAQTFLLYNIDAFAGQVIPNPTSPGTDLPDLFWEGTSSYTYGALRQGARNNTDVSIKRDFHLERVVAELTGDITNIFNHPQFRSFTTGLGSTNTVPAPDAPPGSLSGGSTYGTHGLTTYEMRQIVLGLRITF
jgi:trimeric autotransporter adhesin